MAALRVCDPAEYELETLRAELARSKRDTERANRNVEALHRLLEQKESEVRVVSDDLTQLRLDWSAERANASREQVERGGSMNLSPRPRRSCSGRSSD